MDLVKIGLFALVALLLAFVVLKYLFPKELAKIEALPLVAKIDTDVLGVLLDAEKAGKVVAGTVQNFIQSHVGKTVPATPVSTTAAPTAPGA